MNAIQKKSGQFDVSLHVCLSCFKVINTRELWVELYGFVFQLLLCVGDFFGTSPEAESEWESYKSGAKKGKFSLYIFRMYCFNHTKEMC